MARDAHYTALENMYRSAPINEFYRPEIEVRDSEATIRIEVSDRLFHAGGAVHGAVYFKVLDDAAFFAANSLEREVFVLTTVFNTYLTLDLVPRDFEEASEHSVPDLRIDGVVSSPDQKLSAQDADLLDLAGA